MRPYKINNEYIDLDHVLIVGELKFWEYGMITQDEGWFFVTLAFRNKRKRIGFKYDDNIEDNRSIIIGKYEDFLKAWQNK